LIKNDYRGSWIAQCSAIRICSSCRLYSICHGNRRFLRTMQYNDSSYLRADSMLSGKPLDIAKKLTKSDNSYATLELSAMKSTKAINGKTR